MNNAEIKTLRVPGATLSYEVRGKGPILLLIPGGGNDAHAFDGIVKHLVDQYTVVTYNRRGLSQSTLDDPEEEQRVETHSDDTHRLLREVGSEYEPAFVFGSSGGAIVGLDLVARHPEQVHTLIAHEPPTHLSPEADPIQEMTAIREVYRREGIAAAIQKLMAQPGLNPDGREMDIEQPEWTAEWREQSMKNVVFLFEHEVAMYDRYQLDVAALKNASIQARIVIASGHNKEGAEYWSAVAVAKQLGTTIVEFPGRHVGYVTNPRTFTQRLRAVLGEKPVR
jgi:pimeloyl-ACP methyl ester carboxylesterase